MKIMMFTNTYLPHVGGVARSVSTYEEEFCRRGHDVRIVAPQFEGAEDSSGRVLRTPAIQNFNGSDFSVRIPAAGADRRFRRRLPAGRLAQPSSVSAGRLGAAAGVVAAAAAGVHVSHDVRAVHALRAARFGCAQAVRDSDEHGVLQPVHARDRPERERGRAASGAWRYDADHVDSHGDRRGALWQRRRKPLSAPLRHRPERDGDRARRPVGRGEESGLSGRGGGPLPGGSSDSRVSGRRLRRRGRVDAAHASASTPARSR